MVQPPRLSPPTARATDTSYTEAVATFVDEVTINMKKKTTYLNASCLRRRYIRSRLTNSSL